jgi:O-antigen/teichoic acid export membrane protein
LTLLGRISGALARRSPVFRDSLWGAALRAADLTAAIASLLVLARALQPAGLGYYAMAMATMALVGVVNIGAPILCVREMSISLERREWGRIAGLFRFSAATILICSLASAALVGGFVLIFAPRMPAEQSAALLAALAIVPVFSLSDLCGSVVRAHGRVALGQMSDLLVRPYLFLAAIVFLWVFSPGWLTPVRAVLLQVASGLVSLALGYGVMRAAMRREIRAAPPIYEPRPWLAGAVSMSLARGLMTVQGNMPVLLLAFFVPAPVVAIFRIAQRGADLADLGFSAVSMAAAPRIAGLFAAGQMVELKALLRRCARASLAAAALIFVGYALLYRPLVGAVFGVEYAAGYALCLIMTAARALDCYFGPNAVLLNMTGHERAVVWAIAAGVTAELILSLALMPWFGAIGAAWGLYVAFLASNLVLSFVCRRRLEVSAEAFPLPRF